MPNSTSPNGEASGRDPLWNPIAGDRLRGTLNSGRVSYCRKVFHVTDKAIQYDHEYFDRIGRCSIASWRKWAKTAEVANVAIVS